jgi:hypothetical protein
MNDAENIHDGGANLSWKVKRKRALASKGDLACIL